MKLLFSNEFSFFLVAHSIQNQCVGTTWVKGGAYVDSSLLAGWVMLGLGLLAHSLQPQGPTHLLPAPLEWDLISTMLSVLFSRRFKKCCCSRYVSLPFPLAIWKVLT